MDTKNLENKSWVFYKNIYQHLSDPVLILDRDLNVLFMNEVARVVYAIELNRSLFDQFPENSQLYREVLKGIDSQKVYESVLIEMSPSGRSISAKMIWDGLTINDCILRFSKLDRLKTGIVSEKDSQIESIIDHTSAFAYRIEDVENLIFSYVSKNIHQITGRTREDYMKGNFSHFRDGIYSEDYNFVMDALKKSLDYRMTYDIIYRIQIGDGTFKWIWDRGKAIYDNQNKFLMIEGFASDFSSQKKSEEEKMHNEERYHEIFELMPLPLIVYDMDSFMILEVNTAAEKQYGYSKREFKKLSVWDLWTIDLFDRVKSILSSDSGALEQRFYNIVHVLKDGREIIVDLIVKSITYLDRTTKIILCEEITEPRKLRRDLELLNERLRMATDAGNIGVWELDISTGMISWDNKMYELYGVDPTNQEDPFHIWYHSLDEESINKIYDENNFQPFFKLGEGLEFSIVLKNNSRKYIKSYTTILRDSGETPLKIVGINMDISQTKSYELVLEENRKKLNTILETILDAIFIIDTSGTINMVNSAAMKMFGYREDELLGNNINLLMPEPHHTLHNGYLRNYITSGIKKIIGSNREVNALKKDGTSFPVEISIMEWNYQGRLYFTGSLRDITSRKKIEETEKQSYKMDAISQLTGGLAHDFNNILGIISGNLELLERSISGDDEKMQKRVKTSMEALSRASNIISKLLIFSRKQKLVKSYISMNEVINGLKDLIEFSVKKTVRVNYNLYEFDIQLYSEREGLENTILNLVINSSDAISGEGEITIQTGIAESSITSQFKANNPGKLHYFLRVSDTGRGISDEIKEKIFEPFFSTKMNGKGIGLGLAQVYGFVNAMDASIDFYNNPSGGACFELYFEKIEEKKEPILKISDSSHGSILKNKKILLLDDEAQLLNTMEEYLSNLEMDVSIFSETSLAMKALTVDSFDILVTDIIMPGKITGYQMASIAEKNNPGIKVLFVSGYTGNKELMKDYMDYPFLMKPYRLSQLTRALEGLFLER